MNILMFRINKHTSQNKVNVPVQGDFAQEVDRLLAAIDRLSKSQSLLDAAVFYALQ